MLVMRQRLCCTMQVVRGYSAACASHIWSPGGQAFMKGQLRALHCRMLTFTPPAGIPPHTTEGAGPAAGLDSPVSRLLSIVMPPHGTREKVEVYLLKSAALS